MKRHICMLAGGVLLAGCSSTYQHSELLKPEVKLDPAVGVIISVPADGRYGNKKYPGSGRMTSDAVRSAFSKRTVKVDVTTDCHGESCLNMLDKQRFGYYVKPEILHWEERNTEWSGKPDKIEIQLVIYDLGSQKPVASTNFSGESKLASFGGDHPQDLLPQPIQKYVDSLYR